MPINLGELNKKNKTNSFYEFNGLRINTDNFNPNLKNETSNDLKNKWEENAKILTRESNTLKNKYKDAGVVISDSGYIPTTDTKTFMQNRDNIRNYSKGYKDLTSQNKQVINNKAIIVENAEKNTQKFKELNNTDEFKQQIANVENSYDNAANSYYDYLKKKVDEDDIGIIDKSIGMVWNGITAPLTTGRYSLKNENGEKYIMPTYGDLKQQKTMDSYNTWVGKVAGGALFELGRQATSMALNSVAPGAGTATYFGSMFTDSWNNAISEGYDDKKALVYATLGTGMEVATGKLLGGTTKAIFGTGSSELSQSIGRGLSKVLSKNPKLVNVLSNAISEGSEEFVQEYLDRFNKNLVLGSKDKIFTKETLEDAIYSASVGALTGSFNGIIDSNNSNYYQSSKGNINYSKAANKNDNLIKEVASKTFEANKNKSNVEFVNINDLLPLKEVGGFRTEEQISKLENDIRKNGITTPIKLIKKSDGTISIDNGNHRLEIAQRLGLEEIPIQYVNDYIANNKNLGYNENQENLNFIEGEEDGSFRSTKRIEKDNDSKQSVTRSGERDSILSIEGRPVRRNDEIYPSLVGDNNRPSSDSTRQRDIAPRVGATEERGLGNSSFFLKEKQNEIIQKSNPVDDDYHTWIRNTDEIKTFAETLQDSDYKEFFDAGGDFDETYTASMAQKALDTGKIVVYSSYPIEQGTFVSPSKMEAESYSGNEKVYSKEVSLTDVAWIDPTQGQYAKVNSEDIQNSKEDNSQIPLNLNKFGDNINNNTQYIPLDKNILNPIEISKLTKSDADTTPILPKVYRNEVEDGESKFYNNLKDKTNMLNEKAKSYVLTEDEIKYYDKVTNKESLEAAFERLNKDGAVETARWFKRKEANATDVAEGFILMKQYSDNAEYDMMVEVAKRMRDIGTKAGQTIQAFNIMERMTPEGMVKYAQSELTEAYNQMVKNKSKEWIDKYRSDFDLKPDEVKFIMDTMKEVSKMEDGYDKRVKLAEIQKLMTDKLPPEKGAKIKSWMRISMLFNPKTQVRNVVGNALIAPVNYFSDLFSSYADKIISKKTGKRTTGNMNIKAILKGFKDGAYQATNDYRKGINTKDMEGNRFEIGTGKSFSDKNIIGRNLNRVEGLLNYVMDAGDRVFSQSSFENSLQNQMILNNTTEITQEMIDIAHTESLQRTWNDNNNYTKFVLNARSGLNEFMGNKNLLGYGLGDILIPFAKTPANLTKAIVDYSPVGFVNTILQGNNLRKALNNGQYTPQMQHKFVQSLGKATAGTLLYVAGLALAKAGITSGESDDDKDTANFLKNTLGISSYSIKIGNKSFTYDWAQPLAAPLSITANIVNSKNKDTALLEAVVGNLDTAGSILLEQSFLTSIKEVLDDNDGLVSGLANQIMNLPARAVPTFSKQIVDLTDSTQRTSFEYGEPLKTATNSIKAKIPGLSKTLAPVVDTMGREVKRYGGKNNLFNVFLNPANVNTDNISESAEEIYKLYKETGDKTIMPRVAPYYINKKGEKIILDSKRKAEYQKISGKIIEDNVSKLIKNKTYKNLSNDDKVDVISNIVNYSYNVAQKDVLNLDISTTYAKAYNYSKLGNISDYYIFKSQEFTSSKDANGKTIQNSKKMKAVNYVNSLNLSVEEKALLLKINGYNLDKYENVIMNFIQSKNLSLEEKKQILQALGYKIYTQNGKTYVK